MGYVRQMSSEDDLMQIKNSIIALAESTKRLENYVRLLSLDSSKFSRNVFFTLRKDVSVAANKCEQLCANYASKRSKDHVT